MESNREQGDQQYRKSRQQERCGAQSWVVWEALQPLVHKKPGHRESYQARKSHEVNKIPGQQRYDLPYTGAHYFADADLFLSLLCGKGDQPQQTQTGDQYGEDGKGGKYLASFLVGGVLRV